jgi:hypothetical protein
MKRLSALVASASLLALIVSTAAFAAFAPSLSVSSDPNTGILKIGITQAPGDDPAGQYVAYVPFQYLTNTSQLSGETTGTAKATVAGSTTPLTGFIVAGDPTTLVNYGGNWTTLGSLITSCTGLAASTAQVSFLVNLANGGTNYQVPIIVQQLPTTSPFTTTALRTFTICLPAPGLKITSLTLYLANLMAAPPGWYVWHLNATAYSPTGSFNTAGAAEAVSQDRVPPTLTATSTGSGGQTVVSGRLTHGGKGVVGATVTIMRRNKAVGTGTTGKAGMFKVTAAVTGKPSLVAVATEPDTKLPSCAPAFFPTQPCTANVGGFTIRTAVTSS